jgi:hypothetical protein
MHTIRRNGRAYDRLDPNTNRIYDIVRSLAALHRGERFTAEDGTGQIYCSCLREVDG